MSTNRVVLGVQNDGSVGLRVSAVGVDADVGSGQGGDFTFNSDWTDIAKIHQIGNVAWNANCKFINGAGTVGTTNGWGALFTSLGYRPFMEWRRLDPSTNTINDDYWNASQTAGFSTDIWRDAWCLPAANESVNVIYVIYKIAAPFDGGGAW